MSHKKTFSPFCKTPTPATPKQPLKLSEYNVVLLPACIGIKANAFSSTFLTAVFDPPPPPSVEVEAAASFVFCSETSLNAF